MKEPTLMKLLGNGINNFGYDVGNCSFGVDVITKVDKS